MRIHVYKFLCSICLVLLSAFPTLTRAQMRHVVFQSNSTFYAPEVNVVLFNDKAHPVSVALDFGTAGANLDLLTERTCYSRNRAAQFAGSRFEALFDRDGIKRAKLFEAESTIAIIPPKSFAHRYYPVGFLSTFPCEVLFTLTDLPGDKRVTRQFMVKPTAKAHFQDVVDVSVNSSVETFSDNKLMFITLLFRNNGNKPTHFKLMRKTLLGCAADIRDGMVRQGMEGGVVEIDPLSYAATKTVIELRKSATAENCRLIVEFAGIGGVAIPKYLQKITVPMKQRGKYQFLPSVMLHE
ncbi:hypothetical protein [Massilia sp. CCM 8734]|uniref:hypothetical protein n=1 Tax=Massilia sp. CCM 8734 TaxID=2609283 RepID=UPI00141E7BE2|nr:hypothetical protein [Massilia sp. CCM 8734]NIA00223.1 hypothetical protein [Massilia sp. CCM 8734]